MALRDGVHKGAAVQANLSVIYERKLS